MSKQEGPHLKLQLIIFEQPKFIENMTMIQMIHDMIRMGGFEHDTGALPDANELEYLSALLQTGTFLRQDATISSTDIQNYLTSQYGLDISKEDAIDIVCGLGGMALPNENEDDCYLDLVELTTILLIPSLLKAKQEVDLAYGILQPDQPISEDPDTSFQLFRSDPFQYWSNKEIKAKLVKQRKERALHYSLRLMPRRIIRDVLRILSTKVMEDSSYLSPRPIHEKSIPDMFDKKGLLMDLPRMVLTQGFVEELLTACQLDDESKNKPLIHEMIQIAGGEGAVFDELVFAKLLTSDISLYETGVEDNMDSTFQNVYGSKYPRKGASKLNHQEDEAAKSVTVAFHGAVNNAPSADEDDVERPKAEQVSTSASLSERNQPEEYDPKTYSQESKSLSKRRLDSHLPENNELVSFDKFDEIEVGGNTIDCSPPTIKVIGGSEDGYEATLFDSMVSKNSSYTANKISIHSAQENKANQSTTKNPKFIRTAPHIDYASDQYKSIIYHMMIWCYFIFAAALLLGALHLLQFDELDCDSNNFWCVFGKQVWTWFIFGAILSVSGYLVIAPMSLANSPNARLKEIFISLLWVFLFNFLPFIILWDYKAGIPHSDDGDYNETETLMAQEHVELVMILYLFFGVCIFCEILRTLPSIRGSGSRNSWWFLFHLPSSEEREVVMKRAATHKINNFLRHAHELHFGTNGNSRHILERVVLHGCKTENNGGLVWAWKVRSQEQANETITMKCYELI